MIVDLRFSRAEAIALATLFAGQFLFTSTEVRYFFIALYLALTVLLVVKGGPERRALLLDILLGRSTSGRSAPPSPD